MKKAVTYVIIFVLIGLSFSGCKPTHGPKPIDFPGSRWVSENPPAEFIVKTSVPKLFLTLNGEKKEYAICMTDEFSLGVDICTWNQDSSHRYEFKDILTIGRGTFKSDKFTFKITNDLSGLLEGYDKIVFYRDFEYENKK